MFLFLTLYTWDNRPRDDTSNIEVCLDRAHADAKWVDMFGDSLVLHLQMTESDHCALLIRLRSTRTIHFGMPRERPFRYENMWRRHHTWRSHHTFEARELGMQAMKILVML
jgi:hypothetical protein